MGKAQYSFLCVHLVLPIFAQCEPLAKPDVPEILSVRVDNFSGYPIQYFSSFIFKDGTFNNSETDTLESAKYTEYVVPDNVEKVVTWYTMVRSGQGEENLWMENVDFLLEPTGAPEAPIFWTLDQEGSFWSDDVADGENVEETKVCDWRTTSS